MSAGLGWGVAWRFALWGRGGFLFLPWGSTPHNIISGRLVVHCFFFLFFLFFHHSRSGSRSVGGWVGWLALFVCLQQRPLVCTRAVFLGSGVLWLVSLFVSLIDPRWDSEDRRRVVASLESRSIGRTYPVPWWLRLW